MRLPSAWGSSRGRLAPVVALAALVGCSSPPAPGDAAIRPDTSYDAPPASATGASCPDGGTALDWASFGQPFFEVYCDRCHAAGILTPGDDFGTVESVRRLRANIDSAAAEGPLHANMKMPQEPPYPTDAERMELGVWLACGAP